MARLTAVWPEAQAAETKMPSGSPKILSASGEYETEEGCLSLEGIRKAKRYRSIRLQWQDLQMKTCTGILDGFQAQIVQHEIDHCNGVLI